jgi:Gas vesicle protein K
MSQLQRLPQREQPEQPGRPEHRVRYRLDADDDPGAAERGLASLVLTIVELLRQLMERQALRRVADGTVSGEQAERIGCTLMRLEERMSELLDEFGLEPEDLNIDLGPLGPLLS